MHSISSSNTLQQLLETQNADLVTVPQLDGKIKTIEEKVKELTASIFQAKQSVYWRSQNQQANTNNVANQLGHLRELIYGADGVYIDFSRVLDVPALISRMYKIRQIECMCLQVQSSLVLVQTIEHNCAGVYATLNSMADTLLEVLDPKVKAAKKVAILQATFVGKNLNIANNSPRDIGIELLKLFEMAIEKVIIQIQDDSNDSQSPSNQAQLQQMLHVVQERIQSVVIDSPRSEKEHPRYPEIKQTEIDSLLERSKACNEKFSFWEMLSLFKRATNWARKLSDCEKSGDSMEKDLGQQIAGMGKKLKRKFTKVVEGKVTSDKAGALERKMHVYMHGYMQLKESLESRRAKIYTVNPDESFRALLTYAYGLRQELSEVGHLLDMVQELSTPAALAIFSLQVALKEHVRGSWNSRDPVEKVLSEVLSLFQVGQLIREAEAKFDRAKHSEYSEFLSRTLVSVKNAYLRCVLDMLRKTEEKNSSWEALLKGELSGKKLDLFFARQMLSGPFRSATIPESSKLLTLSYCRQQSIIVQKVVCEYDRLCVSWQAKELLDDAYEVVVQVAKVSIYKERSVIAFTKAVQYYLEFANKKFANERLHTELCAQLHSVLYKSLLENQYPHFGRTPASQMDVLFEQLACCLFSRDAKALQQAQDQVFHAWRTLDKTLPEDIEFLLFENTINKILNSAFQVSEIELARLIDGPLAAYIAKTATTKHDSAKLQRVHAWVLERESFARK